MRTKETTNRTTNIQEIANIFNECNKEFFNGSLKSVSFGFFSSKQYVGRCVSYRNYLGLVWKTEILLSAYFDFTDKDILKDTILHEMIHAYICANNIHDDSSHGRVFQRYMFEINRKGNRNVTLACEKAILIKKVRSNLIIFFDNLAKRYVGVKVGNKYTDYYVDSVKRLFPDYDPIKRIRLINTTDNYIALKKANQHGKMINYFYLSEERVKDIIEDSESKIMIF